MTSVSNSKTIKPNTLKAVPPGDPRDRGGALQPLLLVENLRKHFPIKGGIFNRRVASVKAVDDVSFEVLKGETLGVVGESGCGKSTLARLLMNLIDRDEGALVFDGDQVGDQGGISLRQLRRNMQMVFQDSSSSLNPRLPIMDSVAYGPQVHGTPSKVAQQTARELLEKVGLSPDLFASRYPHELSGGQKQRVNIARALALDPRLLILDEAVSALDKSVEAQVLNLLRYLKTHLSLTYLFISHDLHVVQYISDRVLVMYLGEIVEIGPVDDIYSTPKHPYTQALLASQLSMDPAERVTEAPLSGDPPNPVDPPSGCRFHTRCPFAETVCSQNTPSLGKRNDPQRHSVACHMHEPGSGHSRTQSPPVYVPSHGAATPKNERRLQGAL
ncbi:dipeptide/oligopeptide/nickel ABC transporter ATP-binding protein [Devosia pacifica]|uniref:Glutathione import ATP-binding protein GsiA n=1 Tax=Devosia pacifica TaxID=1335967 RepID=A0A918VSM8_9HYPH|nr:ABC transporter ATP-binding protein [Devosia pacifica]GHA19160.1 dipeptide/oligopeptide/nickel ABC transporter ATP-binding protein [Devosia pacifica]